MKSKTYWIIGSIIVVLIIAIFLFKSFYNPICYDGQGSAQYVSKAEFLTSLNNTSTERGIHWDYLNLTSVATENFNCGDTTYSVKDGEKWTTVSKTKFNEYIDQNKDNLNLVRISQSGNSPFFINDLTTGSKYILGINETKLVLVPSK